MAASVQGNILELLAEEKDIQSLWETHTPLWHPRNEGETETEETETETEETEEETEDEKDPVKKAYAIARAAEKERDAAKKALAAEQRKGMSAAEAAQAERDEAKAEAEEARKELAQMKREREVRRIGKDLKFKNRDRLMKLIDPDATSEADIRKELKSLAKDYPEMIGSDGPPPPVNDNTNDSKSGNARMNDALRAAAGRGRS